MLGVLRPTTIEPFPPEFNEDSAFIDLWFRLNGDFNTRDEIGVRKTFSGLAKLLFPEGEMGKADVEAILRYDIEGRRRVKEQLKTIAGVEFIDVGLGYVDVESPGLTQVVPVPEQSEGTLVPEAPLLPGHVFGIGRSPFGDWAVYCLENKAVAGDFRFKTEGIGYALTKSTATYRPASPVD